MQARIVAQLNIRQPRFYAKQRSEKVVSVLLELSLSLFETFKFEIEGFLFRDLFWRTILEGSEVIFS